MPVMKPQLGKVLNGAYYNTVTGTADHFDSNHSELNITELKEANTRIDKILMFVLPAFSLIFPNTSHTDATENTIRPDL